MPIDIETIESLPEWTRSCENVHVTAVVAERLLQETGKAYSQKELKGRGSESDDVRVTGAELHRALTDLREEDIVKEYGGYYWIVDEEKANDLIGSFDEGYEPYTL